MRLRVTGGSKSIWLDLGARYQVTAPGRYVVQGGVSSAGAGVLGFTTAETRTAMWLFYLGVSMRF